MFSEKQSDNERTGLIVSNSLTDLTWDEAQKGSLDVLFECSKKPSDKGVPSRSLSWWISRNGSRDPVTGTKKNTRKELEV